MEFLDGPQEPNFRPKGPPLHHFRPNNVKLEEQHLKQCWLKGLADETKIQHRVIRPYDDNGNCIQMIYTNFLHEDGDQSDNKEDDVVNERDHEDESDNETDQEQQVNDTEVSVKSIQLIGSENEAFPLNDKELSEFSYMENDAEFPETTNASSLTILSKCQSLSASSTSKSKLNCQNESSQIDTKLGNNIARILGETEDVCQLDQARKNVKSHPTSDFDKNKYIDILVQLQTKILAQLSLLKKEHST